MFESGSLQVLLLGLDHEDVRAHTEAKAGGLKSGSSRSWILRLDQAEGMQVLEGSGYTQRRDQIRFIAITGNYYIEHADYKNGQKVYI
jgi:hypothetical protein